MDHSVGFIKSGLPKFFVMENVPSWRRDKRFRSNYLHVKKQLQQAGYRLYIQSLCTAEHGLPQHRLRTYVVGIRKTVKLRRAFGFPRKLKRAPLHPRKFLGPASLEMPEKQTKTFKRNFKKAMQGCKENNIDPMSEYVFVDVDAGKKFGQWKLDVLPCLTASRGKRGGFFCTALRRRLTPEECLRFQGFKMTRKTWEKHGLTACEMGEAAGNAMSVNVVQRILVNLLRATDLCRDVEDPWVNQNHNPFV